MLHTEEFTNNRKGFTLIELTVSIGLIGVILLSVFNFYSTGQKAYRKSQDQLYVQQNARQAILWLSNSIKQAKRVDIVSKSEIRITTGNGEEIDFYLKEGVLYRRKNHGVNPIADVESLKFIQSNDKTIAVVLSTEGEYDRIEITIRAVPMGVSVN